MCGDKIHQGGGVAAPLASQILSEVLPYLEVSQDYKDQIEVIEKVKIPEFRNRTLKDIETQAKEIGLELEYNIPEGEELDKAKIIIKEQSPKPGIEVNKGSKIQIIF